MPQLAAGQMRRDSKPVLSPSKGRPKTAADLVRKSRALVDSPYGPAHGKDAVERVQHTVDIMHRRHQLDHAQKMAADRCVHAYETCPDQIRCALDLGIAGVANSRSPHPWQFQAARIIAEINRELGLDAVVVRLICADGLTIEQAALRLGHASQREISAVGFCFRRALWHLHAVWWGSPRRRLRCAYLAEGVRPIMGEPGQVLLSPTAHASARGIAFA